MDHSNFFSSRSNLIDQVVPFLLLCSLLLLVFISKFKISPSNPLVEKPRNLLNLVKQLSSHRQPFPSRYYSNSSTSLPTPSPALVFSPSEAISPMLPSAKIILNEICSSPSSLEANPPKDPPSTQPDQT